MDCAHLLALVKPLESMGAGTLRGFRQRECALSVQGHAGFRLNSTSIQALQPWEMETVTTLCELATDFSWDVGECCVVSIPPQPRSGRMPYH